jgi:uncharacterized protein (TIGR00251 family)
MRGQVGLGHFLEVKATPKAARDEITGWRNGVLQVRVRAVAEDGKANEAIIALLAKSAGVSKSAFELTSGQRSRHKRFRIVLHGERVRAWAEALKME